MKILKKMIPDAFVPYIKRYQLRLMRAQYRKNNNRKDPTLSQVGIEEELKFWRYSLTSGMHEDRLAKRPLCANLIELIEAGLGYSPKQATVVDVGSGPLTTLGTQWSDKEIRVVATDTLGAEYCQMLEELALDPPVKPIFAEAEQLETIFEKNSVDLVYCSNALDHCRDPLAALDSMLSIVKPGCYVYIWSYENEGAKERYQGMHQWDLYEHNGDFRIAGPDIDESVRRRLKGEAEVSCIWHLDGPSNSGHIEAKIRKLKDR